MAHLLMLHGHAVGYLPPTYASEILTSDGQTVEQKTSQSETSTGLTPLGGASIIGFRGNKQGKIIAITATIQPTFSAYSATDIATLPEGYRPSGQIDFIALNSTKDTAIPCRLLSDGTIRVYPNSSNANLSAQNIVVTITYV